MALSHRNVLSLAAGLSVAVLAMGGCGHAALSSGQLTEFDQAKGLQPAVDTSGLKTASLPRGPYKVVTDDVLEISMPLVLADAAGMDRDKAKPVPCRVGADGAIVLPIAGRVPAVGKTLSQIELEIIAAYYPKYLKREPSVMARVSDPHMEKVRVLGAVTKPGVYDLRSDEMTLVSAILKAGGIPEGGAASIRVRTPGQEAKEILMPVRGLNVPFADLALAGGEEIEIARFCPVGLTVVGLVKKPGFFPTEPDGTYNLAQALAMAGGIDYQANPLFATVCRQAADGRLLSRPVPVGNADLSDAAAITLRPGDTVVVENSPATDIRIILLQALRVSVGATHSFD
jgi:protein involved in polysaccharide export with SLBB domain